MAEYEITGTKQITELPEATSYTDGMYYAVASASGGTERIAVDVVNNRIDYVVENVTSWNSYDIDSTSFFTKITGMSASADGTNIGLTSLAAYNSYSWEVQKPTKIYFDSNHISSYTSICYGNNYTGFENNMFYCSNSVRKRTADNNLPTTEETAITLNVGDIVVVTVNDGSSATIKMLEETYAFSDELSDFIETKTADTKNAVDFMIEEGTITNKINVATSTLFSKYSGYYADASGTNIGLVSGGYDSYSWEITSPIKVYFDDPSNKYISICYGNNYTGFENNMFYCSNSVRKRTADNNLPTTEETAITLNVGDIVVVTVPIADTIGLNLVTDGYSFTDEAIEQIQEIASQEEAKKPLVVYNSAQVNYETERLYIYIPSGVGYIKYNFAHFVEQTSNANVWVIHPLYATDDSLSDRFALTTSGEFECALKLEGAPDFMGGSSHGSEIVKSIEFFVDGANVSPSSISSLTSFDILRIVEQSELYDPSDETTLVAIHGKEYIFTRDKLTINQTVLWKKSESLVNSYLAMLPVAKTVTSEIALNTNYQKTTISSNYGFYYNADTAISWDDTKGFSVRFSKPKWEINGQNIVNNNQFILTDNGGGQYNKQYFVCCTGGTVAENDLWKTTTEYEFDINK